MNFDETPALGAFRAEVREFLDEHLTDEVHKRVFETGIVHDWGFHHALGSRGWIGMNWTDADGKPVSADPHDLLESAVFHEEAHRAWAPLYGVNTTAGPANALLRCASGDLRDDVMPRILSGEIVIALGLSEPHSGSDVAAATTTAKQVDGGWLVNGQKVFTSLAEEAEYVFLVTRSSTGPAKHDGLTILLVPTDSPGLEIQPLFTVAERTNTTFYSDVFVPDHFRIGEADRGWDVLRVALAFERGGKGFHGHLMRMIDDVLRAVAQRAEFGERGFRGEDELPAAFFEDLGRAATEIEVARLLDFHTAWIAAKGGLPVIEGSMAKLFSSESLTNIVRRFMDHLGPYGLLPPGESGALADGWVEYLHRFAIPTTVYGGVSEVQRSLIAERRLKLPRTRG